MKDWATFNELRDNDGQLLDNKAGNTDESVAEPPESPLRLPTDTLRLTPSGTNILDRKRTTPPIYKSSNDNSYASSDDVQLSASSSSRNTNNSNNSSISELKKRNTPPPNMNANVGVGPNTRVHFEHATRRAGLVAKADAAVERSKINLLSSNRPRPGSSVFVRKTSMTPSTERDSVELILQNHSGNYMSQSERTMSTLSTISIQSRLRRNENPPPILSKHEEFRDEIIPGDACLDMVQGNHSSSLPHIAVATVVEDDHVSSAPVKHHKPRLSIYIIIILVCSVAAISGLLVALLMKTKGNGTTDGSSSAVSSPLPILTYLTMNSFSLIIVATEGSYIQGKLLHDLTLVHLNRFFQKNFDNYQSLSLTINLNDLDDENVRQRRALSSSLKTVTATFSGMASFKDKMDSVSSINAGKMESIVILAFSEANANDFLDLLQSSAFEPKGLAVLNEDGTIIVSSAVYQEFLKDKNYHKNTNPPTTTPPTENPSLNPTNTPTSMPSIKPTFFPTYHPTKEPTLNPTQLPTKVPTNKPTETPSETPSESPSETPTESPSESPTESPSESPSESPTESPSESPSESPTKFQSETPTKSPSEIPSVSPTNLPTVFPTKLPTKLPTESPTELPTKSPTKSPTSKPTPTNPPTTLYKILQTNRENKKISKNGAMFNVVTKSSAVQITGMDIEFNFDWNGTKVFVYTRDGSYEGFENDADGWAQEDGQNGKGFYKVKQAEGLGKFTEVPKFLPIDIPANTIKGFYVSIPAGFGMVLGKNMITASDKFLDIVPGVGKGYPFDWTNTNVSWSGALHYLIP